MGRDFICAIGALVDIHTVRRYGLERKPPQYRPRLARGLYFSYAEPMDSG